MDDGSIDRFRIIDLVSQSGGSTFHNRKEFYIYSQRLKSGKKLSHQLCKFSYSLVKPNSSALVEEFWGNPTTGNFGNYYERGKTISRTLEINEQCIDASIVGLRYMALSAIIFVGYSES